MIRIQNLTLPVDGDPRLLKGRAARLLGIPPEAITGFSIARQSIDARKKSDIHYTYAVHVSTGGEEALVRRLGSPNVTLITPQPYRFPPVRRTSPLPPVVVGMGPAGLLAALLLARNGIPPILLERGQEVDARAAGVEAFWRTGVLSPYTNVQFGEGGAGTFSDGKLTTGTHDPRIPAVLEVLVEFGAPADVAYSHKPHIGTDILRQVVKNIRLELLRLGCQVYFQSRLSGIRTEGDRVAGITYEDAGGGLHTLPCDTLVLAPGHSARDTFDMLHRLGVPLEQKQFAVGVRIEHRQAGISRAQFGPAWKKLPPADYKLSCHLPSGRSVFTFCVCPGGQVVAAASGPGQVVTNGMSLRARDGENINGGLLVGVGPADFPGADPLAGVRFQEQWEGAAWALGGGSSRAPAQTVEDFLAGRPSTGSAGVSPTYRPGVLWTDLHRCLPREVAGALEEALPLFDRRVRGFAAPGVVLTGVETRSSSPVRILRDSSFQSALRGLYPCGEGAGYAGGIVSAAVDGIRVAEAIACRQP